MSEPTKRNPHTDPWGPHASRNPHAVLDSLRAKHAARAALAAQAVAGGKLSAADQQDAGDFLAAAQSVLASTGPVNVAMTFLLESTTAAIDLRRAHQQAEAKAAKAKAA